MPAPAGVEPAKAESVKTDIAKGDPLAGPPASNRSVKGGDRTLKFRFKGESWVEVRDSRGRALFQQLNRAGSEAEVTAKPPFTIIVGNAGDVQMSMNDQPYDLEPHTRVAVARFTVQ
jgi:cytoskeleton protein RodZ